MPGRYATGWPSPPSGPPDSIESNHTVFMSVPDLQAIPVGRIATSLAATRRGFQAGLYDLDGGEGPFEDLAQVREVVRRGYLAGGLGPGGAATPAFPSPPSEPGADGGAYFGEALEHSPWLAETSWYERGDRDLRLLREQVPLTVLARLVQRFGEATAVQWESNLRHYGPAAGFATRTSRWGLREWYLSLLAHRVWEDVDSLAAFVTEYDCPVGIDLLKRADRLSLTTPYGGGSLTPGQRRYSDQELLQSVPCPLLPGWNPNTRRLMDLLLTALSDAQYFAANPRVPELVPILLAARVSASSPPLIHGAFGDGPSREELMDEALRWLAEQTPHLELPYVVEDLLSQFVRDQLEGPSPQDQAELADSDDDWRPADRGHDR